ncbi:hypothetical protein D477_004976 [Arthrobacter crystallopoietes BAB-32]|uniref:Hpt domain-containing protein n=1 Tax=Arthrobacter crystallopoietes BAB-32 TaxID=1246476 RepID=N1VAN0_9MICC|nr:hypothetical protein [Arthrobacter crystallopoietes]EMY35353.1 hypothetical protein D477_004976 [Arthrobacter crystallopoietes BAB-32]
MTASDPYPDLPLIDPHVLEDLASQLESTTPALTFAQDFVLAWPGRCVRLSESVAGRDLAAAMDAVLSLKIASTMVGAAKLARLALDLEGEIRGDQLGDAKETLVLIRECGDRTAAQLEQVQAVEG